MIRKIEKNIKKCSTDIGLQIMIVVYLTTVVRVVVVVVAIVVATAVGTSANNRFPFPNDGNRMPMM